MTLPRNSTIYGLANTSSFRRASKKIFRRWGSNLQNPSPKQMEIYVPSSEGNVFVQPDQAGAEALVVSYLTPKGKFRELFLNNIKSHTYVASHIFRDKWRAEGWNDTIDSLNASSISSLPSNPAWAKLAKHIKACDISVNGRPEYFIGKKSCHSFNYRMRPSTFQEDVLKESEGEVALTKQEAEYFHYTYHTLFPEISQQWWPELEFQVRKTGYLYNLFGYPRYCQGPYTEKSWRELTSWVPQSTVGCITAIAFCAVQQFIEENGLESEWHLLNDKHDSFMGECPFEHKEIMAEVMSRAIEQYLVSPRGEEFQMKSEVQWGRNWAKMSQNNPEGMRAFAE